MCAYGMTSSDEHGVGYVYKPTKFMTNAPAIADQLARKCSNVGQACKHRHVNLMNGRAKKAQIYPPELCKAICRGLKAQKEWGEREQFMLGILECKGNVHDEHALAKEASNKAHD
eukprot:4417126-Karenia_brevis.AAC.1